MIVNSDIKEAIIAVIGKKQKITRAEVAHIIERILVRAGIYTDNYNAKKVGVIGRHNHNMMLINVEQDGYKLLPILQGQRIELMVDGVWQPVRVITDDNPNALCRQRLDVSDDVPIYGVYARVIVALDGSTAAQLPVTGILKGGDDNGK